MKPEKRKAGRTSRASTSTKKKPNASRRKFGARFHMPGGKTKSPRLSASRPSVPLSYSPQASILSALRRLRGKRVLVTAHSLADTDAVASASALADWLGPRAVHALADRANSEARRLLPEELHAAIPFSQARGRFPSAPIVLLDANDPSLLPHLSAERIELIIDHHALSADSMRARAEWVEPRAASCSELVASIIGPVRPPAARALALGMLSDSAQLMRAEPPTLRALASLLEHSDSTYEQLLEQLRQPPKAESRAAGLE
ncbi:MAG: DHH family phosphoesterase, partial [Candidatus Marsarchaeota archaeon]|nr:DHH family phosphoesterase [Candidatus Marsarchaeota archaeon]